MKTIFVLVIMMMLLNGCGELPDPAYAERIMKWRSDRVGFLRSEAGFVNLAGLYWFKEGVNVLGSVRGSDVVLPADFPPRLATYHWAGDFVVVTDILDEDLLVNEARVLQDTIYGDGRTKEVSWGTYRLYVIKRADKVGLRIKNFDHPRLGETLEIPYYPIDEEWVIKGKFEPYDPPKTLMIQNIVGLTYPVESPGRLVFDKGGQTYSLDPSMDGDQFYITFGDRTNGEATYGAGRYLYADPPDADGTVILDFNKAYNPPCAFTEYATCPLPPSQNKLSLAITAGEKAFHWDDEKH